MAANTEHPKQTSRDRDLLLPDEHLTESELDKLWDLFCSHEQGCDAQVAFVKLINSVRRLYLNVAGPSLRPASWAIGSSGYTPSDSTEVMESRHYDSGSDTSTLAMAVTEAMEANPLGCRTYLQNERRPAKGVRMALRCAAFNSRYLQMVPDQRLAKVSRSIGGWETFELIRHAEGMVSFKSTTTPEVYLSADGSGVEAGKKVGGGAGSVTCQPKCGHQETFWLRICGEGRMGIECVAYPGRFVRSEPNEVTLQGVISDWEHFYLIILE